MEPFQEKRLEYVVPPTVPTLYATHLLVQGVPGHVILSFCEVRAPVVQGKTVGDQEREWAAVDAVPVVCQARVAVALADVQAFVTTILQHVHQAQSAPSLRR